MVWLSQSLSLGGPHKQGLLSKFMNLEQRETFLCLFTVASGSGASYFGKCSNLYINGMYTRQAITELRLLKCKLDKTRKKRGKKGLRFLKWQWTVNSLNSNLNMNVKRRVACSSWWEENIKDNIFSWFMGQGQMQAMRNEGSGSRLTQCDIARPQAISVSRPTPNRKIRPVSRVLLNFLLGNDCYCSMAGLFLSPPTSSI